VFLKVLISQFLKADDCPEVPLLIQERDSTSDLAAAVVVNYRSEDRAEKLLLARVYESGGFCPTAAMQEPNLAATLKALYALRVLGTDLSPIRDTCLQFIESLRCEDGGYLGCASDDSSDVENTFYALFSIGCLMADAQPEVA
jgi:prenyltransferase beta subunit